VGWALANLWYDKFNGLPPRNSLLETIFLMVMVQRRQAQLLETRALVQSIVGLHESKKTQDPAIEAFEAYCSKMFPVLSRAMDSDKEKARTNLADFVKKRAKISMHQIYKQQAEHAKKMATLKRFKLQPKMPGTH